MWAESEVVDRGMLRIAGKGDRENLVFGRTRFEIQDFQKLSGCVFSGLLASPGEAFGILG